MDGPTPKALSVSCAGQDWILEFESAGVRDGVARWLGPWARVLREEDVRPDGAGLATFVSCTELPGGITGVRRHPEGIGLRTRGCHILTRETGRTVYGEIRFQEGTAIDAVRLALRVLVMRTAFARGAVALHAASVRTSRGAIVFVGPTGSGKTAAAGAFPPHERLDDDLVLLAKSGGRWVRLDLFDKESPARRAPRHSSADGPGGHLNQRGLQVRAVLRPEPGDRFRLIGSSGTSGTPGTSWPLGGGEALLACFHVPAFICVPGGERAVRDASSLLERLSELVEDVPVARFEWAPGEDLPALLEESLVRSG